MEGSKHSQTIETTKIQKAICIAILKPSLNKQTCILLPRQQEAGVWAQPQKDTLKD